LSYVKLFDAHLTGTFSRAAKLLAEYPKSAAAMFMILEHEASAQKVRNKWLKKGVSVPPLLIVSTTEKCNLECKGCYSTTLCHENTTEMTRNRIERLLKEASSVGCSAILLAGGEPLLATDWIYAVAEHKGLLGLVFTNGMLFNDERCRFFYYHRNLIPLFSIEGSPERTDDRRGIGVTGIIKSAMKELYKLKVPFGISITTGSHNLGEVTDDNFLTSYIELGCRLVIHVEYVQMGTGEEMLPLTPDENSRLSAYCDAKTRDSKAIVIAFPGNEEQYGGCLAAGRGFLHISASGLLEPCPFAPYSDRDLTKLFFIEALNSPLLKAIRAEANSLHEGIGGCSLRNRETWIREIISGGRTL